MQITARPIAGHPITFTAGGNDPVPRQKGNAMTYLNNEASELNEAELEVVSGGMDCKTGQALGKFYNGLSDCMAAIGNYDLAIQFAGTASNYIHKSC
jgi:hypothetical protein